jgi:hypothetical protein
MSVIRSSVYGVVGPCKTESSQKPVPMHPTLADADALEKTLYIHEARGLGFCK